MAIVSPIHFYKDCLPKTEMRVLYDKIEKALLERKTRISVPYESWMNEKLDGLPAVNAVFNCVFYDQPGLFYINKYSFEARIILGTCTICWAFLYSPAEIDALENQLQQVIGRFKAEYIRPDMNSAYVEKRIFDYLIRNISYIKRLPSDISRERKAYNTKFETQTVVGALIRRECVCEGVAMAFKMLADSCRLISIVVIGMGNDELHAWNLVKVQGHFYQLDATWGLRHSLKETFPLFRYSYYNLPDDMIACDHALMCSYLPKCHHLEENPFYIRKLLASNLNELETILRREFGQNQKLFSVLLRGTLVRMDTEELSQIIYRMTSSFGLKNQWLYWVKTPFLGFSQKN